MCMYIYVCVCVCMYVCVYMYIYLIVNNYNSIVCGLECLYNLFIGIF